MAAEPRFARFAAIDWSGAVAERPAGLAIAVAEPGSAAPVLIDRRWSRGELRDWIAARAADAEPMLIGIDLSFALPFVDMGAYLPGLEPPPRDACALWALVERMAAGAPHLGLGTMLDHAGIASHFRQTGRCGTAFPPGRGRLRRTEAALVPKGLAPSSVFNLVGPAQVGKSSLTGMRMLHALTGHGAGRVAIWPFDPLPPVGPVIVEIYTAVALQAAGRPRGRKLRDAQSLDAALAILGSAPHAPLHRYDDHRTDAILTAAWLRTVADDAALWHPRAMTPHIAATEGWTFGVA